MFKKLRNALISVLVVVMAASLIGCSGSGSGNTDDSNSGQSKPVPEDTGVEDVYATSRVLKLISGNSVESGEDFVFLLQNIGTIDIRLYSSNGKMVATQKGSSVIIVILIQPR